MEAAPRTRRAGAVVVTLTLASLAYAVMQMMVVPALPEIERDLGSDAGGVAWLISAFLLSTAVSTPVLGRLGDLFGKERMLVAVLAVFACGGVVGALAPSLPVLIVARVMQGLGGAIFPLSFAIARDTLPSERLAPTLGLISGSFGVGGAAGLVASGPIVDHVSWHGIFWLGIAMPLVAIVCVRLFVPPSPPRERVEVDWVGALLLAGGLLPPLLAVSRARAWGWGAPGTLALLAGGAIVLALWARWELRRRAPLIDVRLLRVRAVATVNAVALCVGFGMYATSYLVPQLVQADPAVAGFGFDASVTQAAFYLLPAMLAGLVCGPLAGSLCQRIGGRLPMAFGVAMLALGLALLGFVHDERWQVYLGTLLAYGIGLTFALTAMAQLILTAVPQAQTGEATGINTMLRTVGGALGSQVVATLVLGSSTRPTDDGFLIAFAACAAVALVALAFCLLVPRPARR
ncbi:MFS transporter [Conexibacter sp. JD483]|uniref:MFS transporter n=1 Tax=unclassified Conexibacter TaxID=2627773 RepID=UPI0027234A2E|nr:MULTISPECIES: MFS transporter [unclassified Conexibacter]MDO8189195.1 MFS transporter [Conexibacter sp. CPCC 205706]MDO8201928.1 MFS transporter [Conexibacter sp. CPCC 205762]MDR9371941.1 MFS transporter [Conexibacter sp. JD483]